MSALARRATREPDSQDAEQFIQWFNAAREATEQARTDAERDEDYYNNKQLTADERAELRKRGQPEVTTNYIRRKVDYIMGVERQTRTDPKAFPRTPSEDGAAEAATDALRYAADRGRFAQAKSKVTKNLLIHGFGGCYVGVQRTETGYEVVYHYIPWDRLFYDPYSSEPDFSDARYVGFVTWLDYDDAVAKYPEGAEALETGRSEEASGTYDDKPKYLQWYDRKRRRVRVAEMYYRADGVWRYACFTRGGLLQPVQSVSYLDDQKQPECCLVLASAYVDRENNRHGIVRDLVPVQDEINKRRSKALHTANTRQFAYQIGLVEDAETIRHRLAQPDAAIGVNGPIGDAIQVLPTNDISAANVAFLQDAKADMQMLGPNAAMQGKDPRQQSGRAIQAQQQGGLIELAPILDALRDWQNRVMRQTWNRIRQFWTEETWVRVTDDDEGLKFVGLNRPITLGEALEEKAEKGEPIPPEMAMQLQANPAMAQQVVGVRNNVAALDVDIIIDEQPDVVTLQAETFEALANMVSAGLPVPPDVLIEASPLPNKTKRAMLEKMEQQSKAPDPETAEKAARLELDAKKAEGELSLKAKELELKGAQTGADVQLKQAEIELRRMEMQFKLAELDYKREELAFKRDELASGALMQREKHDMDMQTAAAKAKSQAA